MRVQEFIDFVMNTGLSVRSGTAAVVIFRVIMTVRDHLQCGNFNDLLAIIV
jgi:hypothetical protein